MGTIDKAPQAPLDDDDDEPTKKKERFADGGQWPTRSFAKEEGSELGVVPVTNGFCENDHGPRQVLSVVDALNNLAFLLLSFIADRTD